MTIESDGITIPKWANTCCGKIDRVKNKTGNTEKKVISLCINTSNKKTTKRSAPSWRGYLRGFFQIYLAFINFAADFCPPD